METTAELDDSEMENENIENRFNLIDEPWIPVADIGRVSLKEIFSNPELRALGGNPVQKIAITKLLLAIAQAAATPRDDDEWELMGWQGLADKCLSYLEQWHDRFYLYGEKPFLQMPGIMDLLAKNNKPRVQEAEKVLAKLQSVMSAKENPSKAEIGKIKKAEEEINEVRSFYKPKPVGVGIYPDVWSDNNTILTKGFSPKKLSDSDLALFVVISMNNAFGGKRVMGGIENFSGEILGSRYSAAAGPSIGSFVGNLHCFCFSDSIIRSIWLNLFTEEHLASEPVLDSLGVPPWEQMPSSESDSWAMAYKKTYMATLIAISRFILIKDGGVFYLDGIRYPKVSEGWFEASLIINRSDDEPKPAYVNLDKKPWRSIASWIEYSSTDNFECIGLKWVLGRRKYLGEYVRMFVGGVRVSSNSGDQSIKQSDDFLESIFELHTSWLGEKETQIYQQEIEGLSAIIYQSKKSVEKYFHNAGDPEPTNKQKKTRAKEAANSLEQLVWVRCERHAQELMDICFSEQDWPEQRLQLRRIFTNYALQTFDQLCPNTSARQMDAWAQTRPNFDKYLKAD